MPHAFDPEIAAAIPMLPNMAHADLPTQRRRAAELLAALPAADATGLEIEDRRIPGSEELAVLRGALGLDTSAPSTDPSGRQGQS